MTVHEDHEHNIRFVIDQPSRLFDSFGHREILKTGLYLDKAVGRLLKGIGFPVPHELAWKQGFQAGGFVIHSGTSCALIGGWTHGVYQPSSPVH